MKQPNFFIIGAPKCGTTALSEYMRAHPQVFMCTPKEPHYFAEDFPRYRGAETWDQYLEFFRDASREHKAIGEASVYYLYSNVAVPNLLNRVPSAKLIVMLRNPVDLARSMHAQALYSRDEVVPSFEEAWRLCKARGAGEDIPDSCRDVKVLLYDQIARLGEQLERLLQHASKAQVRWWFLDELSSNPGRVYREVLSFLEVDDDGRRDFPQINRRKLYRSQTLGQFTMFPPSTLANAAMHVKKALFLRRLGILDFVRRLNTIPAQGIPLNPALAEEMHDWFAPDIRRLQDITGRDLSHWNRDLVVNT